MANQAITQLLVTLAALKADEKRLAEKKAEVEKALCDALTKAGQKTVSIPLDNGKVLKGTLVEGQRVVYDSDRLQKTLGPKVWPKVSKSVLDATKLEAAITMGIVDPNVVAQCADVKDSKPYVKVSGDTPVSTYVIPVQKVKKVVVRRKP